MSDSLLVEFEEELMEMLKRPMSTALQKKRRGLSENDFVFSDEDGVKWFNANQCAYALEGCKDNSIYRNNARTRLLKNLKLLPSSLVQFRKVVGYQIGKFIAKL